MWLQKMCKTRSKTFRFGQASRLWPREKADPAGNQFCHGKMSSLRAEAVSTASHPGPHPVCSSAHSPRVLKTVSQSLDMIKQGEDAEFHPFLRKWFRIERFSSPIHEAEIKGLSYPLFLCDVALRSCSPLPLSLVPSLTHNGNEMRLGKIDATFSNDKCHQFVFPLENSSFIFVFFRWVSSPPPSPIQSFISFPDIICTAYRTPKGQAFLSNPKHTHGHLQQ